jgi:hypothetical protein
MGEELGGGREALGGQAHRTQEELDGVQHPRIVVHDVDPGLVRLRR